MKTCDACGRNLEFTVEGKPCVVMAVSIELLPTDLMREVLAPYEPGEYNICYPCYLKSLGIPAPPC